MTFKFHIDQYLRRSTAITALVDASLLFSNFLMLKRLIDNKEQQSYFALLVTILSVQILVQVVLGILLFVIFGPNMMLAVKGATRKTLLLRRKMREFRIEYKEKNPKAKRPHDDEVLDMFPLDDDDNKYKEKYFDVVIDGFKNDFKAAAKDKTDEEIWQELRTMALAVGKMEKEFESKEGKTKRKDTDTLNDAAAGLAFIILILKVFVEVFYVRVTP